MSNNTLLLVGKPGYFREAIASLLAALAGVKTLSFADSCRMAAEVAQTASPGLVLVAPGLPARDLPIFVHDLKEAHPRTACLVLAETIDQERQALLAGADCVITGSIEAEKLLNTVASYLRK